MDFFAVNTNRNLQPTDEALRYYKLPGLEKPEKDVSNSFQNIDNIFRRWPIRIQFNNSENYVYATSIVGSRFKYTFYLLRREKSQVCFESASASDQENNLSAYEFKFQQYCLSK